jgi:hypothetical protein
LIFISISCEELNKELQPVEMNQIKVSLIGDQGEKGIVIKNGKGNEIAEMISDFFVVRNGIFAIISELENRNQMKSEIEEIEKFHERINEISKYLNLKIDEKKRIVIKDSIDLINFKCCYIFRKLNKQKKKKKKTLFMIPCEMKERFEVCNNITNLLIYKKMGLDLNDFYLKHPNGLITIAKNMGGKYVFFVCS